MTELAWIVLACVLVVVGLRVVPPLVMLVHLLRMRVTPVHILMQDSQPPLQADEEAALAELLSMGFQVVDWAVLEHGSQRTPSVLLHHPSEPAFAGLSFLVGHAGYDITFYGFTADGAMLATGNRSGWAMPMPPPGVDLVDAYADTLQTHWEAHRARAHGAVAIDNREARRRINAWSEGYFDCLRESGAITRVGERWYPTLNTALRMTWAWMQARKRLARPYRSEVTEGEHQDLYAARFYQRMEAYRNERGGRRSVKLWLLALSLGASLIGWGLLFNWTQAVILVLILLLHEGGHALAMRAFGYRDMSLFFVPMLGAVVTGTSKALPAWKQAVILLAGPLPGLLAGLAALIYLGADPRPFSGFDWQLPAMMAVMINLFNLLPITPLDGGQLVEVALFSRWPNARLAFHLFSVAGFIALALWIKVGFVWVLVLIVALSTRGQWRITRLQSAWREGVDEPTQLSNLFEAARQIFRGQTVMRQYPMVKAVFIRRSIRPARAWEGVLALLVMVGLWSGVAAVVVGEAPSPAVAEASVDTRTPAQVTFDDAYVAYEDGDEAGEAALAPLDQLAEPLAEADPRRVDLAVLHAFLLQPAAQQERLAALLKASRPGDVYTLSDLAEVFLEDVEAAIDKAPSPQRADRLIAAADHVVSLASAAFDGTVATRLRAAEAYDQAGDTRRALALLGDLDKQLGSACGSGRRQLVQARAWYHIAHQQAAQAVKFIETSLCAGEVRRTYSPVASDYAWALLAAGRLDEGVEQMRQASYAKPFIPTLKQRLRGVRARAPLLIRPLDMAYALRQANRPDEARALIGKQTRWACRRGNGMSVAGPWQQLKVAALDATAAEICPAEKCKP
jgi:Zn-dependent protease